MKRMNKPDKYWIVVGKNLSRTPFRHNTYNAAKEEMFRLATKYKGDIFTVFGAITEAKVNSPQAVRPIALWHKIRKQVSNAN